MYKKFTVGEEKPKLWQMNLRVREDVRDSFKNFCTEHEVTQSEGLRLLLAQSGSGESAEMIQSIEEDMKRKQQKITELQKSLETLRSKYDALVSHGRERSDIIHSTLKYILGHIPEKNMNHPLANIGRNQLWAAYQEFSAHPYPTTSGCCIFKLKSMMYATVPNPPLFLMGTADDDKKVKFRITLKRT